MKRFEIKLLEPGERAEFQANFKGNDGTTGTILLHTHRPKGVEERLRSAAIILCGELQ